MRRTAKVLILAAGLALVPAAQAWGHAFYVDDDGTGTTCATPETACPTIAQGLNVTDDVVLVTEGTYNENIAIPPGKFVLATETFQPGDHVIQPAGPGPTVTVTGNSGNGALVNGLTIKGPQPVVVNGPGRVSGNRFTDSAVLDDQPHVLVQGTGTAIVEGNTFDSDGSDREVGIESTSTGSPLITGNTLTDLWHGIDVGAGTPAVRSNVVQGTHNDLGGEGRGIAVTGGSPTVSANVVRSPAAGDPPTGVHVEGADTGATLLRNRVSDHDPGVDVAGPTGAVSLESDLISGGDNGLAVTNASVSATNLTAFDSATREVSLQNASLTLNSSIVEHAIATGGASTCAISFSAGPATSGGACEAFQLSNSGPGFANPGGGNYDLTAGSPLIDAGDPAPPAAGALDLGGDPRAFAATCGAPDRRDIGADELTVECPATPAPPGDPPAPPPGPPPRDADPPTSRIDKMKLDGRTVKFRFSADEPASSFRCKLDDARYRDCESPKRYRRLEDGRHVFRVRATDVAGNEESGGARKRFRIR